MAKEKKKKHKCPKCGREYYLYLDAMECCRDDVKDGEDLK